MEWILNIVKMAILHKLIYRFKALPIKTATAIFVELDNLI